MHKHPTTEKVVYFSKICYKTEFMTLYYRMLLFSLEAQRKPNIVVSYHQYAGQNHNLLITNKAFENVAKFKYLGMTAD
jgi:hypothetical protein